MRDRLRLRGHGRDDAVPLPLPGAPERTGASVWRSPLAWQVTAFMGTQAIFFYLMDPKGKFVDAFGRSMGAREVESKVKGYLEEWKEGGERGAWSD